MHYENDGIFQKFRIIGIVMQDTKPPIFQNSTFFTGGTFLIET